ncbi:MAG TPA: hypothetical protein VH592_25185 [Gemmataceae bacterium]|jgi:hypothetical protein
MNRYFVEFEFESPLRAVYWFSLTFHARSPELAADVARAFRAGIEQHHRLRHMGGPERLDGTLRSPRLKEYIGALSGGKAVAMEVNAYTLRKIEPDLDLSFDENMELAAAEAAELLPATIASLRQHKMRVRMLRESELGHKDEFLVINIINPQG